MWWIAVEDLDQASGPAQLLLLGWKYTIIGQVQSHVGWSRATWAGLYISHHQLVHGSMIPPSYRLTQSCQCPPVIGWLCFHPPVIGQLCYHIPAIGQCVTILLHMISVLLSSLPPWLVGWYFRNWQFQDVVHHWLDYDYGYADIIPYIFNNYFSTCLRSQWLLRHGVSVVND